VLLVGRLSPEKGLDLLVRAWSQVPRDCDATLVVIGGGVLAERVAEWIRRSGLADRVRLVGAQLDVDPFYRAADVLVVPSRSETFGNALAEAMSHGLAVVTTPVGLASHWISHGDNGLVVRGEDGREMAAALEQLIRDAPMRHRLGAAARRQALASFAPDAVVGRYRDLYARLSNASLPAPHRVMER
jgi:glycosyltransferase involved in cell wall biosynthesis